MAASSQATPWGEGGTLWLGALACLPELAMWGLAVLCPPHVANRLNPRPSSSLATRGPATTAFPLSAPTFESG